MPCNAVTPSLALSLVPALVLALGLTPAWADEANLSANSSGSAGTATRLVIAQRAYLHALEQGEVFTLVAAIRLARSVTLRPATAWQKTAADTEADDAPVRTPDPASPAALTIAQNLAGEDPDLQDLVYDLDAQIPRSRLETAVTTTGTLAPGQTDSWRIVLFGEVPAELALIGDGKSPLGLTMTDEGGSTVCTAPASRGPVLCRLTPARNGFFNLAILNPGEVPASYRLIGN